MRKTCLGSCLIAKARNHEKEAACLTLFSGFCVFVIHPKLETRKLPQFVVPRLQYEQYAANNFYVFQANRKPNAFRLWNFLAGRKDFEVTASLRRPSERAR